MSDIEKANQKQREAWEKLNQAIEDAIRELYYLMEDNKTDYQRLNPDIENEIKGGG